jgi:hypothetical protein
MNDLILTQLVEGRVKNNIGDMWRVCGRYVEGIWKVYFERRIYRV